ncbi:MAG TPA: TIGR03118 family protein [Candidatus Dormibacteraeota bacterium]|nr:TIGR03118 family protein [Candidatus Dormibacteraeota bacterium]
MQWKFAGILSRGALAVSAFACLAMSVTPASAQYKRTDLVSNQAGAAPTQDGHLVNGWGLVALPTSPFWVSDNGTGFSTLYTGAGQPIHLFVTIPAARTSPAGSAGTPTGVVGNISRNATDFTFTNPENNKSGAAVFIFATLDGTISAWNPGVDGVDATTGLSHATIAADSSSFGAVYTGLAIATNGSGQTFLYAADDGPNRRVDMFDSTFKLVQSFSDPGVPKGFAPYGIQAIGSQIWVTYTALNKAQGGFVDVFDTEGVLVKHFAVHGPLHSPWGIAQAPADFGPMSNAILISNNISRGRINAFDAETGQFLGPLRDAGGKPIEIDGVWALQFGQGGGPNGAPNQLFFTAGPNNYANGLFGVITFGQ